MAISFGRRGSGGDGGVNVVFLEAQQSSHADLSNNTWVGLNFKTPVWQLGGKATGKAALNFGVSVDIDWNSVVSSDITYEIKAQAQWSDNQNSGFNNATDVNILNNQALIYQATEHTTSDTNTKKNCAGYIPFSLSSLPSGATDGKYITFGLEIRVQSSTGPHRIRVDDSYVSFASYGNGYGIPPDGSIETFSLADGAVTNPKLADGAVGTSKIASGAVGSTQIANGGVATNNIADGAITQTKIGAGQVSSNEIADYSITQQKIATGAVNSNQIADGSINNAKLDSSFHVPIDDGAITTDKIADSAVTNSKIAVNAVRTAQILNNSVTTDKIVADAITNAKMADNAIGTTQLLDGSVSTSKLIDQFDHKRQDRRSDNQARRFERHFFARRSFRQSHHHQ